VLAVVLGPGMFSAEAQDRDRNGERNRSGQAQARRDDSRGEAQASRGDGHEQGGEARARPNDGREQHGGAVRAYRNDRRYDDRVWRSDRHSYGPPRIYVPRRSPYRHYGPGPGLSVYFGIGSGYRYGAPYSGRVYGYAVPSTAYGVQRYYGDVRLEVRPREAAVYVDGYYAGIVDDFDGVFQRLTLEAGRHRIEIELPGFETRAFDVAVDPTRTVEVHEELFPERR